MPEIVFYTDFDGTVSRIDTIHFLLSSFADPVWFDLEQKMEHGELDEMQGLRLQIAQMSVSRQEAFRALRRHIEPDPDFPELVSFCRQNRIPIVILSGGFAEIIEYLLQHWQITGCIVRANHIRVHNTTWKVGETPFRSRCHGCNHCKSASLVQATRNNCRSVFAGDGITDRCPAFEAELVFARDKLAEYCRQQGIPFTRFARFKPVIRILKRMLGGDLVPANRPANRIMAAYGVTAEEIYRDVFRSPDGWHNPL